jgi:hypothetical protein
MTCKDVIPNVTKILHDVSAPNWLMHIFYFFLSSILPFFMSQIESETWHALLADADDDMLTESQFTTC